MPASSVSELVPEVLGMACCIYQNTKHQPALLTCSAHGVRDTYRCLFRNVECSTKVGTPRTQEEYKEVLAHMSADKRCLWYDWVKSVMVCKDTHDPPLSEFVALQDHIE